MASRAESHRTVVVSPDSGKVGVLHLIQTRSGCSRLNVIPSETGILIAEVYTSCFIQDGGGRGLACVIKYGSVAKPPHPNLPPCEGEGTFSMLKADC